MQLHLQSLFGIHSHTTIFLSPQAFVLFSSATCPLSPLSFHGGSRPPEPPERAGTRTILPAQGDKEDTAEIVTLPTVVTFQPGTAVGRIFARRSVVTDVPPRLISDFVVGVFHHNADLRAVVVRFNNTDIDKVCTILTYIHIQREISFALSKRVNDA